MGVSRLHTDTLMIVGQIHIQKAFTSSLGATGSLVGPSAPKNDGKRVRDQKFQLRLAPLTFSVLENCDGFDLIY